MFFARRIGTALTLRARLMGRNTSLLGWLTWAAIALGQTPLRADYPIVSQRYLADPASYVQDGRVYLYCSNDDENTVDGGYVMKSIVCVSSTDLKNWTDHGVVFRVPANATWAQNAWAPAVVARNGRIYLYFGNGASGIGVASSISPTGPFTDARGGYLINSATPGVLPATNMWVFDPAVFIDDDGQAYLYFGGNGITNARVIRLNADMISTSGSAETIATPNFFEASWMHKRNGVYYFSYSANPSSGMTIDYLTSTHPMTGFTYVGIVAGQPPSNNNNNHHAIFELNGEWYHAYHNRSVATQAGIPTTYRRNLGLEHLSYNADGTIQRVTYTTDGLIQLATVNPYVVQEAEMMNAQSGIQTETCTDGGLDVHYGQDGAWTRVRGIDFGLTGATRFSARVAAATDGGSLELRLASVTGARVGTLAVASTGGVQTWVTQSCAISGATGVQDLYLVYRTAGATALGVDSWQFAPPTAPTNLAAYRARLGEPLQFTVTGSATTDVRGTDVYTDDSSIAAAAVHAGVLRVGETSGITIVPLPGQPSYADATRNGLVSTSAGATSGSFAFAAAGAIGTTTTTVPMSLAGFVAPPTYLDVGERFVCPVLVGGGGPYTYQWYRDGTVVAGATMNPFVIAALAATDAGAYSVDVTNSLGTRRITARTLVVGTAGAPMIQLQPLDRVVFPGSLARLTVTATGAGNTYQWFRDGVALPGQTAGSLAISSATPADTGAYSATITNAAGSATTRAAAVTVDPGATRVINMSCRTQLGANQLVSPGFYISGTGRKQVLIRVAGPALAPWLDTAAMPDPQLTLFHGQTAIAQNDNWDAAAIGDAFSRTGAFGFAAGSRDAALLATLDAGQSYTAQVTGVGGSTGVVLLEVYDADAGTPTCKLANVSVRGTPGQAAASLVLGFVMRGTGNRTLLIRGAGPALRPFHVDDPLPDPQLAVYDGDGRLQLSNHGWGSNDFVSALIDAGDSVAAFGFPLNSPDAATLTQLAPASYTVHITSPSNASGEALAEVYEIP